MPKVLLPTFDDRGGIGRYVQAITSTLPEVAAQVLTSSAYLPMIRLLRTAEQVWVTHVLPVGTAAMASRVPYVIFLHGLDFDLARRTPWKRWLTQQILRRAKAVVTNSRALADEVAAFAGIATPLVVYPCVNDAFLDAADMPRLPFARHETRLLTVARLVERKGHRKVLEAMRELPNTVYDIVGEGPYRAELEAAVQQFGLERRVRFHGMVPDADLAAYYQQADVFVMPATKSAQDREGFGTVYLEANLFDLPVVAVDAPGVNEAVLHQRTGLLIDDTHDALVEALLRLQDPALRAALGMAGRERVLAEFVREVQFGKLRTLL